MPFDPNKLPKPEPSLWDKVNTPMVTVGGDPTMQGAQAQMEQEHPYLGAAGKFLMDTMSQYTSPLSVGSGVLAGTSLLGRLLGPATPYVQKGLRLMGLAGGAGQTAAGAEKLYKAAQDKSGPEALAGALETTAGLAGLGGHFMKGVESPQTGPDYTSQKGLRVALDSLKGKPIGPIDDATGLPRTVTTPEELDMHRALDAATLRSKQGPIAQEIYGERGRPDAASSDKVPVKYKGDYKQEPGSLPIVSRGLSISDAQKVYNDAMEVSARQSESRERAKGALPITVQQELIEKKPLLDLIQKSNSPEGLTDDEMEQLANEMGRYPKGVVSKAWAEAEKKAKANRAFSDRATVSTLNNDLANQRDAEKEATTAEKERQLRLKQADRGTVQMFKDDMASNKDELVSNIQAGKNEELRQKAAGKIIDDRNAAYKENDRINARAEQAKIQAAQQNKLDELRSKYTKTLEPGVIREKLTGVNPDTNLPESATILKTIPKKGDTGGGEGGGSTTPPENPPNQSTSNPSNLESDKTMALSNKIFPSERKAAAAARSLGAHYVQVGENQWKVVYKKNEIGVVKQPTPLPKESAEQGMIENRPFGQLSDSERAAIYPHLDEAVKGGFNGDVEDLANRVADYYSDFRDNQIQGQQGTIDKLFSDIRKGGGMLSGSKGDAADIEKAIRDNAAAPGKGANRVDKRSWNGVLVKSGKALKPDALLEHLNSKGMGPDGAGWGFKDQRDLAKFINDHGLEDQQRLEDIPKQFDDYLHSRQGNWWDDPTFRPKGFQPEISDYTGGPTESTPEAPKKDFKSAKAVLSKGEKKGQKDLSTVRDAIAGGKGKAKTVGNGTGAPLSQAELDKARGLRVGSSTPSTPDEDEIPFAADLDRLSAEQLAEDKANPRPKKWKDAKRFGNKNVVPQDSNWIAQELAEADRLAQQKKK